MQTSRHTEFKLTPTVGKKIIEIVDKRIREVHVTKEDFTELKNIVSENDLFFITRLIQSHI